MQNLRRIVFFWIGSNTAIPSLLVRSVRRAFGPAMEIVQLSDADTPEVEGVSFCRRTRLSARIMVARLEAYAGLEIRKPTLFLDADMLVLRQFDLPPLGASEVGITIRNERDNVRFTEQEWAVFPEFKDKCTIDVMPYIYSFVYAASEVLFVRQLTALRKMPKRFQQWYGDQITLKKELDSGRFVIREFDGDRYNRTVRSRFEFEEITAAAAGVCLVHFKGPQSKQDMLDATAMIEGTG